MGFPLSQSLWYAVWLTRVTTQLTPPCFQRHQCLIQGWKREGAHQESDSETHSTQTKAEKTAGGE